MNAVLKLSFGNNYGNLIWMPPYLYPSGDLENGIEELRGKGYWISFFPDGDGLTFKMQDYSKTESLKDFEIALPWMSITNHLKNEEFDYNKDLFNAQIIILPLTRLRINSSIYSKEICVFPEGQFQIEKINFEVPHKFDEDNLKVKSNLRDLITSATHLDKEVFLHNPLVVFRDTITIEEYSLLSHQKDIELIKKYSEKAEIVLDLIRFFECDYLTPEILPARAGIWNDRHSSVLLYFPKYEVGFVQSREVELKTFIKGIGADFQNSDLINNLPLFIYTNDELGEVGKLCKHALRLNSLIAESDNESLKFIQIMTLFEYFGNPYEFENFKKIKGRLISYVAKNRKEYLEFSETFRFYSEEIRTKIIHNGNRIEDLLSTQNIKELFTFLHKTIYTILYDFMINYDLDWKDYQIIRIEKQKNLLK